MILLWATPARVPPFCHELDDVQSGISHDPAPPLTLEWMGHSTFSNRLVKRHARSHRSARRLRFASGRLCRGASSPPAVSMDPRDSVHMAPRTCRLVLPRTHAVPPTTGRKSRRRLGTVLITPCPPFTTKAKACRAARTALVVFRVDDVCIAHLGDLGPIPAPTQDDGQDRYLARARRRRLLRRDRNRSARSHQASESQDRHPHALSVGASGRGTRRESRRNTFGAPVLKISEAELPTPTEVIILPWGTKVGAAYRARAAAG